MKLVIDISEQDYLRLKQMPDNLDYIITNEQRAIKYGIPLKYEKRHFVKEFEQIKEELESEWQRRINVTDAELCMKHF